MYNRMVRARAVLSSAFVRTAIYFALLALGATAANAQSRAPRDNFPVTDGAVNTMVESGGRLYIGGAFTYVGPNTGSWATFDAGTGAVGTFPTIDGIVRVMIS